MVQREMAKRGKNYHSGIHPFSGKIKCGDCGSWYGSKVWHSTDRYRRVIWQCNHKFDGERKCSTPHLTDKQIQGAFLSAANKLLATKKTVIANGYEMTELFFDTKDLETERDKLLAEAQLISDAVERKIYENAHKALDQSTYRKNYDELAKRYEVLKVRIDELNEQIRQHRRRKPVSDFLTAFEKTPDELAEFTLDAFIALTEFNTVYSAKDIRVTFRNGQEMQA